MEVYSFLYKNANCKWSWSKHSHPKLTLLFLLVQVTAFSLSDILCLWPFSLVWSPAPHLSTMMLTSLSVSVRLVPSTFSPVFLTKFLNWLQLARLRMTKRLLQLVHSTLLCSHLRSGSVAEISWSSLLNVKVSSYRHVKFHHRNYKNFTYHFLYLQSCLPWFVCLDLVSFHAECHPSQNAQVDSDSHIF